MANVAEDEADALADAALVVAAAAGAAPVAVAAGAEDDIRRKAVKSGDRRRRVRIRNRRGTCHTLAPVKGIGKRREGISTCIVFGVGRF